MADPAELASIYIQLAADDARPGQIMSAVSCVTEGDAENDADIREYMSGNLCRCAAYPNIVAAVRQARPLMKPKKMALPRVARPSPCFLCFSYVLPIPCRTNADADRSNSNADADAGTVAIVRIGGRDIPAW